MNDDDLFDYAKGQRLAQEGMERAAENAGPQFREAAFEVLREMAGSFATFTADDFWRLMALKHPEYPSHRFGDASGSVFQRAYKAGIIRRTGERIKSARPEAHSKEIPVLTRGEALLG